MVESTEISPLLCHSAPVAGAEATSTCRNGCNLDQLIVAEVDTGNIENGFSWSKLWKYTGPGRL